MDRIARNPENQADHVRLVLCDDPYCLCIHIMMCDVGGKVITDAPISLEGLPVFMEQLVMLSRKIETKFNGEESGDGAD